MTEPSLARLGLGLAALGRPGYINLGHSEDLNGDYDVAEMERRAHSVLDVAYEAGVRYFDAARSYGRAEEFLSSWISSRRLDQSSLFVASKWGYEYTADWKVDAEVHEQKEHNVGRLEKQWRESRDILGDAIDLYQIHSATLDSGVLHNTRVLARLSDLKAEGVAIGLSVSGPRQSEVITKAIETTIDGRRLFDAVQATWNLLERSAGEALSEAHEKGLRVVVKESLANGRLTDRNTTKAFREKMARLKEQVSRLNTTVDALSIAGALSNHWADTVLLGAASEQHVLSNVKAVEIDWDSETAEVLETLVEEPESYWKTRSELEWN